MEFNTIPEMFFMLCNHYGNKKNAIMYKKDGVYTGLTHSELREIVECFAVGLLNLGILPGDRIGLVSENRYEWMISSFAISSIGAVDVPTFSTLTPKQLEFIFNNCSATGVIVSNNFQLNKIMAVKNNIPSLRHIIVMNEDFSVDDVSVKSMDYIIQRGKEIRTPEERRKIIEQSIEKIEPDTILTIIYTSGTTGNPKGVVLTHKNIISNIIPSVKAVGFTENDVFLSYLPWCHAYERTTGFYAAFSAGATIALAEAIETVGANIKEIKPTYMTTVPKLLETVKKRIYNNIETEPIAKRKIFHWAVSVGMDYINSILSGEKSKLLSLKYQIADKLVFSKLRAKIGVEKLTFVSGGAPLSPEVCMFFLAAGITVLEGYGLTEASPVVSVDRYDNIEPGTVGSPLENIEVRIADDGEIIVRGPNVMKGYWLDDEATNMVIDEEGWLYTGDIGNFTEKGNLKITDRKKNIFVSSGGKNVAPQPIENLLCQSPYIEQCFLVGDKREFITALITPDFEQLKKLADNFGIQYSNPSELINNQKIVNAIKNEIDRLQSELAKYERVRKFSLLSQPFTIENGELTPKMSVRRHVVESKYNEIINQMYGME